MNKSALKIIVATYAVLLNVSSAHALNIRGDLGKIISAGTGGLLDPVIARVDHENAQSKFLERAAVNAAAVGATAMGMPQVGAGLAYVGNQYVNTLLPSQQYGTEIQQSIYQHQTYEFTNKCATSFGVYTLNTSGGVNSDCYVDTPYGRLYGKGTR